jgi:YfiH family protein
MQLLSNSSAPYYTFDCLTNFKKEIKHFVTTRHGGVSDGPFASLNLGLGTQDKILSVLQNRQIIADAVGIKPEYFVMANQSHGINVEIISKDRRGAGAFSRSNAIPSTDAMITNEHEICLFVMGADCVPILFYDPVKKVVGAAHSGWKGTVTKITTEVIRKMQETYQCNPADIYAAIGPSIGPCCYKVGGEVMEAVLRNYGTMDGFISFDNADYSPNLNLWAANKFQLLELGVPEENIEVAGICTHCNHDDFYSSRYGKGITGRFGAGIMLK